MSAPPPLSAPDQATLLGLARTALLHHLGLGPAPLLPAQGPLAAPRAAILSVSAAGELRASLGTLAPEGPLGATVARLAARAVDGDPRTLPLTRSDASALALRLAVLGPLRPLPAGGTPRPGAEGLAVTQGWHRGVLLPSVAAGKGWDAQLFLKHACLAAGLPARAHLEPGAAVEVFEVQEFGDP
jgi:AMMECR1 domain-containing protein